MESRDSQIYRTDQGQKTNVCKSRLKISFQTSMRVHKIDSQPALLYNSRCTPSTVGMVIRSQQNKLYKYRVQEGIYDWF